MRRAPISEVTPSLAFFLKGGPLAPGQDESMKASQPKARILRKLTLDFSLFSRKQKTYTVSQFLDGESAVEVCQKALPSKA